MCVCVCVCERVQTLINTSCGRCRITISNNNNNNVRRRWGEILTRNPPIMRNFILYINVQRILYFIHEIRFCGELTAVCVCLMGNILIVTGRHPIIICAVQYTPAGAVFTWKTDCFARYLANVPWSAKTASCIFVRVCCWAGKTIGGGRAEIFDGV